MHLPELSVGRAAAITGIDPSAPEGVAMRLRQLGFRPGNEVRTVRVAPLGDPITYRVVGYEMCLRREEARHIEIAAKS